MPHPQRAPIWCHGPCSQHQAPGATFTVGAKTTCQAFWFVFIFKSKSVYFFIWPFLRPYITYEIMTLANWQTFVTLIYVKIYHIC